MYRLIHFHTDKKFIHDSQMYTSKSLQNIVVFLGDADNVVIDKLKKLNFEFYIFNKSQIEIINNSLPDYDGVVLYDLNNIKIEILKIISNDKKVFLRLFGYELYKLKINKFVSKTTLNLSYPISLNNYSFKKYIKKRIKRILGVEFSFNSCDQKILYSRIDAILLFNEFEYQTLQKYFHLPKFIQLPIVRSLPTPVELSKKSDNIIIGNSDHLWNNHLDVFKIITKSKGYKKFNYVLFFNYGSTKNYARKVKEQAISLDFVLIENFLDRVQFNEVYENSAALVVNSYRQHALGNIFTALLFGTKLYLNKLSSTYMWLKKEGFVVSEIKQLSRDIDKNRIKLTSQEYFNNINKFKQLRTKQSLTSFIENILEELCA